ncbi:MAG: cytochrome c [Xanthomonadales bacterium]|nr:cytochrome c [Xanthomonadales bacterium]
MRLLAALLLALPLASPAKAEPPAGDPERGRSKAYTCRGCHGIPGYRNVYPHYHVPLIAGQNESYLVEALKAYREGRRRHPTMRAQGLTLSDQDIADIAAFLARAGERP